jgi:RING-type zinc-finger
MMQKLNLGTLMKTSAPKEQQTSPTNNCKPKPKSLRRRSSSTNMSAKESQLLKTKPSTPSCADTIHVHSEMELIMADTTNNDNPLLPLHMNPSEPFLLDDFKDPSYEIDPTTGEVCSVASMVEPRNSQSTASNAQLQSSTQQHFKSLRKRKSQAAQPQTPTTSFWAGLKILESRRGRGAAERRVSVPREVALEDLLESAAHPESAGSNDIHRLALTHPKMTTPLHEAARLGDAELVRLMLAHPFVEPNFKNGQRRTALHMVAGGWTEPEERLWRILQRKIKTKLEHKKKQQGAARLKSANANAPESVGISSPEPIEIQLQDGSKVVDGNITMAGAKKAARAMSRFFHTTFNSSGKSRDCRDADAANTTLVSGPPGGLVWDEHLWNQFKTDRMDCLLAILSWSHPDDGSTSAGEGASVNAVDSQGRTALHYAAELGREDLCMAVLSSFGAMLTVVDDSSRTPCELAAEQNHPNLAAQLEARALLYSDPYGMDDELLAAVMAEHQLPPDDDLDVSEGESLSIFKARMSLVAPFSWFRTLSVNDVDTERAKRMLACCNGMMSFLQAKEEEIELRKVMYGMKVAEVDDFDTQSPNVGSVDAAVQVDYPDLTTGSGCCEMSLEDKTLTDGSKTIDKESGWEPPEAHEGQTTNACSVDPPGVAQNDRGSEQSNKGPASGKMKDDPPGQTGFQQEHTSSHMSSLAEESIEKDEDSLTDDDVASLRSIQSAHIEQYLSRHGWVVDKALGVFAKEPKKALEAAGIPFQALGHAHQRPWSKSDDDNNEDSPSSCVCLICFDEFDIAGRAKLTNLVNCSHTFCNSCIGEYLADCAQSRSTGLAVPCPHHECVVPMSLPELQKLAPNKETLASLSKTSNDNFISSAVDLRFCSHPGCDGIVKVRITEEMKKWGVDYEHLNCVGAVCTAVHSKSPLTDLSGSPPVTYEGVIDPQVINARSLTAPQNAHRFCFGCGEAKVHFPVACEVLESWKQKMMDEVEQLVEDGEGRPGGDENYGDIAQRLWMRANTRPCPKASLIALG